MSFFSRFWGQKASVTLKTEALLHVHTMTQDVEIEVGKSQIAFVVGEKESAILTLGTHSVLAAEARAIIWVSYFDFDVHLKHKMEQDNQTCIFHAHYRGKVVNASVLAQYLAQQLPRDITYPETLELICLTLFNFYSKEISYDDFQNRTVEVRQFLFNQISQSAQQIGIFLEQFSLQSEQEKTMQTYCEVDEPENYIIHAEQQQEEQRQALQNKQEELKCYYYYKDSVRVGPVSQKDLYDLCREGTLTLESKVWKSGMQAWKSIDALNLFKLDAQDDA